MEFVSYDEVVELFDDYGIAQVPDGNEQVYLRMDDSAGAVHLHVACPQTKCAPRNGATVVRVDKSKLPAIVEQVIHLLHLNQVVLIPVGKWRKVFDAVAFSMAQSQIKQVREEWQEIDATATVELNTRDPLLCEPGDFHTMVALIQALLSDAETSDQGLMMVATATPVLVELVPDGAVRLSLGSQVLADEVAGAFAG